MRSPARRVHGRCAGGRDRSGSDRCLTRAQVARRLPIGQPDDVYRHDCVSVRLGVAAIAAISPRFEGSSDFGLVIGISLEQEDRARAPHGGPLTTNVGVAQGAQQVSDVVVAAKPAPAPQHARDRVLHEVLRLVAGAAQRPRRTVERVDVIRKDHRIATGPSSSSDASRFLGCRVMTGVDPDDRRHVTPGRPARQRQECPTCYRIA